jgi:glycine/D-amino acid oxidase-like deaminating enzyme
MSELRVTIVGAGVIGCASALALARRGVAVTAVDRNGEVGHGSTSASCAIVRRFYSQPGMIAMAHEAAQIWADWGGFLGPIGEAAAVFERPGFVLIPPRVDAATRATVAEMQRVGIRARLLDADELRRSFPFLETGSLFPPRAPEDPEFDAEPTRPVEGAVHEEDAGYVVSPGLATHNLRLAAEREGARFLLGREVRGILPGETARYRVDLGDEQLEADVVVNAAGPHSGAINRMAGVELPLETRPLRREVHALANPHWTESGGSSVPVVVDLEGGVYFRPESGGRDLIVGSADPECDEKEWVGDPDSLDPSPTARYRERQCLRLMKRLPDARLGPPRGVAALYDVTVQDWYPIVDRTQRPGYYVCIGTSGSSFKTSPVLGELVAQLVTAVEGGRDVDREPLQLELPRIGATVDTAFLSRNRAALESTGTVIG